MSIEALAANPVAHRAGWALVHFVWQGVAAGGILWLVLRILRNASANARYVAACAGLLAMTLLPIGTFVLVPGDQAQQTAAAVAPQPAAPEPVVYIAQQAPPVQPARPMPRPERAMLHDADKQGSLVVPASAGKGVDLVPAPPKGAAAWRARIDHCLPWFLAIWAAGVLVLSVRLAGGWLKVQRMKTLASRIEAAWAADRVAVLSEKLGLSRAVRVLESTLVRMPLAVGWIKPVILLPAASLVDLTPEQLEAIVAHELAHVRRFDYLVNLIQTAVETLLFYHPCVWWASRRIRIERENCCDDAAVAACGDKVSYVAALARLMEAGIANALPAPAAGGSGVVDRVKRLLHGCPSHDRRATGWLALPIIVAFAAVMVALAVPKAQAQAPRVIEADASTYAAVLTAAKPGDTIVLAGGDYGDTINISVSGAEASPITIKAKDGATFGKAYLSVDATKYASIESFNLARVLIYHSSNVSIRKCVLKDSKSRGIQIGYCKALIVEDCDISGAASHGISDNDACPDSIFRRNTFRNNKTNAIQLIADGSPGSPQTNILVEKNIFAHNGGGLNFEDMRDSVIRNNLGFKNKKGIIFYTDAPYTGSGVGSGQLNERNKVVSNTIYCAPNDGFFCFKLVDGCRDNYVHNNIFWGGTDGAVDVAEGNFAGLDMDDNIIGDYPGMNLLGEKGPDDKEGTVYTLGFWKFEKGLDKHSLFQTDPGFVSTEKDDYHLAPNSPARDMGADLGKLCSDDIDGTARPLGAKYDAGCYEGKAEETVASPAKAAPEGKAQKMTLKVVDKSTKEPIAGARIKLQLDSDTSEIAADAQGVAMIETPAKAFEFIEVTASGEGHSPVLHEWQAPQAAALPDEYTLALPKASTVGGAVRGEDGQPIEGATVTVSVPSSGEPERSAVANVESTTDAAGKWQCAEIPEGAEKIDIAVTHPSFVQSRATVTVEALKSGQSVTSMRPKYAISGVVVDSTGNALKATLRAGQQYEMFNATTAVSDDKGAFAFEDISGPSATLVVSAPGFASQTQTITWTKNAKPLKIVLEKGKPLRGLVVDSTGTPIAAAYVVIDSIGAAQLNGFIFQMQSDANGRFEWKEAPAGSFTIRISKQAFMDPSFNVTASDDEQKFTIVPKPVISGTVVDAETGAPIDRFKLFSGQMPNRGGDVYYDERNDSIESTAADGHYTYKDPFRIGMGGGTAAYYIKVEARDHKTAAVKLELGEPTITLDFKLEKAASVSGIVKRADGSAAAGVMVGLATLEQGRGIYMSGADPKQFEYQNCAKCTTDRDGRFWFAAQDKPYVLVALADDGYAQAESKDFEKTKELTLAPFGKVEGEISASLNGKDWQISVGSPDIWYVEKAVQWNFHTTPANGRFAIDRVVPGTYRAERCTYKDIGGGRTTSENMDSLYIVVKPGETTKVDFATGGRTVIGRVILPKDRDLRDDVWGGWVLPSPPEGTVPADVKAKGMYEVCKYIDQWRSSKEAAEYVIGKHLGVMNLSADGSIKMDNCSPGKYDWNVTLYFKTGNSEPEIYTFEVPPAKEGDNSPVDLGVIRLKASGPVREGEPAVPFKAETISGETVSLDQFKGKHLVLFFMATDNRSARAGARALEALRKEAEGKVEILGFAANDAETLKKYAAETGVGFALVSIGQLDSSPIAANYNIDGIPRAYLISPDGTVVGAGSNAARIADDARKAVGLPVKESAPAALESAAAAPAAVAAPQAAPASAPAAAKAVPRDKYLVAVLDDCDPDFRNKAEYSDTITLYDSDGNTLWQLGGLNTCQTIGGNHCVVYDGVSDAICLTERVSHQLLCLDLTGKTLWKKESSGGDGMGVDPKTGNLWMLTSSGTIYGDNLVVLDPNGAEVAKHPVGAFDMVYSAPDDCFWTVGKKASKIGKDGKVLWSSSDVAWCMLGVAVNSADGSVWAIDGQHPDVGGSQKCIIIYERDGKVRKEIPFADEKERPFAVAVDSSRGAAWVAAYNRLLKLSLDGEVQKRIDVGAFSVAVDEGSGDVWAAGNEGVWKLNSDGKILWMQATPGGSQKWLCVVPPRK